VIGVETQVQVVRLYRWDSDSKVKAFVDVSIGDFVVKGLRLVQGKKGLFLAMPQEKSKDGKWFNSFYPRTKEAEQSLAELVLAAYKE
jgi:stage V sporulation protein G